MTPVIAFENVALSYTRDLTTTPALQGLDLVVEPGEIVGVLGRNGAGKSTMLELAMGILKPDVGGVSVFGLDPHAHPVETRQRIGYVADRQLLPVHLRAESTFALYQKAFPGWSLDYAKRLAERFKIDLEARILHLSTGKARQLSFLLALAHRPPLLLLDEPAAGLDPFARRLMMASVIELLADVDSTVVFSSHHMNDVERLATRVILLDGGRVWLDEKADALREGYCLAVVDPADDDTLCTIPDAVRWRRSNGQTRVVMRCGDTSAAERLAVAGLRPSQCWTLSLEDLFIELAGDEL